MTAKHKKTFKMPVKGSTIIISLMYLGIIGYVIYVTWFYNVYYTFPPQEISMLIGGCFITETMALAAYKIGKERGKGSKLEPHSNSYTDNLGVYSAGFNPSQDDADTTQPLDISDMQDGGLG